MATQNTSSIDDAVRTINWERIEKRIEPIPFSGCWIYTGYLNDSGYAIYEHNHRPLRVHRLMYHRKYGGVTDDAVVCHRCDVTCCVNPDHLFIGTQGDNIRDMHLKGRAGVVPISKRVTKLAPVDVRFIRDSDRADREIARMFDIGHKTVAKIRAGKIWRHLE